MTHEGRAGVTFVTALLAAAVILLGLSLLSSRLSPAHPVQSCQEGWYGKLKPGPCADYHIPPPLDTSQR